MTAVLPGLIFLVSQSVAVAQNAAMKRFLLCSAYGSAIGAGVGLVSLAFTEDPGKKLNTIARGASLGLYGGMIWGAYSDSPSTDVRSGYYGLSSAPATSLVAIIPSEKEIKIQSQWLVLNF